MIIFNNRLNCSFLRPLFNKSEESLENFILLYKKDVDNIIQNEIIQFKKYWSISKPSYLKAFQ